MASVKLKNTVIILVSLLMGGLISTSAYHYLSSPKNNVETVERKILFWYDPMKPNTKFDKPGKSPFMDMDLVPKYADEEGATAEAKMGVRVDPTQTQNLGVRTEKSHYGKLTYSQTIPANVNFNEYQYAIVQSRSDGFIEKVYPLTVGDKIKKQSPLIELTIPEWVEAQSEYLLLASTGATNAQLRGALERLRLSGMPEADIQRLIKSKKIQTHFTIKAPIDGVITAFDLRTGMNISKDKIVAKIQGMDPIWLSAAVPESMAYLINDPSQLTISVPAYPDRDFKIQKWNILPSVDASTRTLQLRLQVDNQDESLKPGMYANLTLNTESEEMLLIPSQAVIDTGTEQRVITLDSEGRFIPKAIKVFHESQQQTGIISGLSDGESVVVSGLFLIDSEANISGALERMREYEAPSLTVPDMTDHSAHSSSDH